MLYAGAAVEALAAGPLAIERGEGARGGDLKVVDHPLGLQVAFDDGHHLPFPGLHLDQAPTAVQAKLPDRARHDGLALGIEPIRRLVEELVEPTAKRAGLNAMGGKPERVFHTK